MAELPTRAYALDLGPNGHFTFASAEEVIAWVNEELNGWAWVAPLQPPASTAYRNALKTFRNHFGKGMPESPPWDELTAKIREEYKTLVHRSSRRGKYVESLKSRGDDIAAAALAEIVQREVTGPTNPAVARGMLLGLLADLPSGATVSAAQSQFDELNSSFQKWSGESRRSVQQELAQAAQARTAITDFQTATVSALQALQSSATAEMSSHLASGKERVEAVAATFTESLEKTTAAHASKMSAIEKTFEEELALREPVAYWRDKRRKHRMLAGLFGGLFGVAIVVTLCMLPKLLNAKIGDQELLPSSVDWNHFPLGRVVVVGIGVSVVLWVLQTLARLFFTNIHLGTDADERVVMVTTYLALLKEDENLKQDGRKLVIERLFRHTPTGIVKEDARVPILMGMLNKGG